MRRGFIVLVCPPGAEAAERAAEALARRLEATGAWRRCETGPPWRVWTTREAPLPCQLTPSGEVILGEAFPIPGAPPTPPSPEASTTERARRLSRTHWGQFVALVRGEHPDDLAIYRDPSGLVDAVAWSLGDGLQAVASDITRLPPGCGPRHPFLNWDRIVDFLAAPTAATTDVLFDDASAVGPGELLSLDGRNRREAIWSPLDHTAPIAATPTELAAAFVERLDACTAALVSTHPHLLVELSGGLDSSVVAAALCQAGQAGRVAQWLNVADARPEADESRYARAVADRLGVPLTVHRRRPQALTEADLADLGRQMWPMMAGVDATRDRDELARIRETGATAIVSGQGGDAVFFQMASALVLADAWRAQGVAAMLGPLPAQLARRLRTSAWTVVSEAWRSLRTKASGPKAVNALITDAARAASGGVEHAWMRALEGIDLPPGKRFHVRALATNHFNHAVSRRREAADLVFPLLAQPIVELALSVPTPWLAGGNHARPFQRMAFAERLPALVRERRAKGNVSVYLAQMMAQSLPLIGPYLLDGCLAAAGVLDRRRLERVLDREFLIQTAAGNDLVGAIAVEAWVRHWQTRAPDSRSARWRRD